MKAQWLLILVLSMMTMEAGEIFAKERKNLLKELSNSLSSRSAGYTDREKKINKGFEWVIQGVNILGQVDNFISDRTKNIIRKLHTVYNEDGEDTHRNVDKSLKRRYYKN